VQTAIIIIVVFILAVSLPSIPHAQFKVDTVQTGTRPTSDTVKWHMTKSPATAILLSAIIPGGGQAYLNQWWKVPIIYAAIGSLMYGALLQNSRYHYISDSVVNQTARGELAKASAYANAREFYRDDRDKFYIYSAIVYIANILDAYIAANLYDFDVSDEGAPRTSKFSSDLKDPLDHHLNFNLHLHF
jgi:hypothetical protein